MQSVKTKKKITLFHEEYFVSLLKVRQLQPFLSNQLTICLITEQHTGCDVCAFDELGYWFRYHDSLRKNENKFFRLLDYVDVKHQAENIKAEVVMVIGPKDTVVFSKPENFR